jgi:hypothetical protein
VKVTFFRGASLDPVPPVAGKDEHARSVHLHEGDDRDADLFASWIAQAAALPGWGPG